MSSILEVRQETNIRKRYKKDSDYVRYKVVVYNKKTKKNETVGTFKTLEEACKQRATRKEELARFEDGRVKRGENRMARYKEEYVGRTFGRLLVKRIYQIGYRYMAICECVCGKEKDVSLTALINETTMSCGCLRRESAKISLNQQLFDGTRVGNLKFKARNSAGIKGVYRKRNSYQAMIWIRGERIYLGSFKSLEEAKNARQEAEEKYHKPVLQEYRRYYDRDRA